MWLVWCLRVYSKWVQLGQLEVDLWSNRSDFTNLIYYKQKSCIWKYVFFVTSTISQSLLGQAMPNCRSSQPELFLGKGVLNICSKFTGQHPCRSTISTKLLCNFIEITIRHGCSPVNLLYNFRTPFLKNASEWLLLQLVMTSLMLVSLLGNYGFRIVAENHEW